MKRVFIIIIASLFLSGCAAIWNKFPHSPKKEKECNIACDYYGNCEKTCK